MKVLLIGYGKMGQFICRELKKSCKVSQLYVYDIKFDKEIFDDNIHFLSELTDEQISTFDAAFISTPANTHCPILERIINCGVKNIYVEKPAVINKEEYEKIMAIKGDCRIVVGYILRQSKSMSALKRLMSDLYFQGFRLELCSVSYQKYLPVTLEQRAQDDIGVFEEIVHVWDLLFNYFALRNADIIFNDQYIENDPQKQDRPILAKLTYLLSSNDCKTLVNITSSFKAKEKKRDFYFTFKDFDGNRRNVFLSFDSNDSFDKVSVTDSNNSVLFKEKYQALVKLENQIGEVFKFFETGEENNLCLFEKSDYIDKLIGFAGVKLG